ncbi:MAG: prephenate dehydrogenase/arogenate dehydrogenase family protein [Patescibacteria group bacterium]
MPIHSVGIIGYGAFGRFLHSLGQRLYPAATYRVYSRRATLGEGVFCSFAEAAQADVVILCGAISEYEEQLLAVLAHARPETIIVDVATVKEYTSALLATHASDRPYLCLHPMFGPESYEKQGESVAGLRIVVTDSTLLVGTYTRFLVQLRALGFVVVELSATEHDRILAETLFLTHLIGQTVRAAGIGRTVLDTVSFGFLLDAVESVAHDTRLFQDVYRFNPHCHAMLERYDAAESAVVRDILGIPSKS